MKLLRRNTILALLLLIFAGQAFAQDAREIVKKADEKARGNSSIAQMTITTVRPKWTRSMELKVWGKGTDYALLLVQSPAKDKGVSYLKRKNEVWNWLPTLERTIKLPPSMMGESWMGTDFTNDDLVKEASVVDDYTHTLLGTEKQAGRDCYKIQMIPKPDAAIIWGKLLMWIDKSEYLELRTEFYDEDGELVNTMIGSEVKNIGGRMLPTKVEMIPAEKKGHKTTITYSSIQFDQPLSDSFFTTNNMTKVK
ncbi:MAG: outer membrane lipoprotein-sorting protein [Lewinellaceae bacterium]|nr:outer membrane lipoprotein-sorting protein [Saprospiraceae bacterium]MCB9329917.1 outer membrane lipoprotein-sorting protein [Lewinellaceae bacterium]